MPSWPREASRFMPADMEDKVLPVGDRILRDEGEAYVRKLIQAGVDVTAVSILATHHDFGLLNALADTSSPRL